MTGKDMLKELTTDQKIDALQAVLLAIQNLRNREGVVAMHDPEDPDAAIAGLRQLARQYGGKSVSSASIDAVIKNSVAALFPQFLEH